MTRVAVIGAGIVGVSTALWLARDGQDVVLIDRAEPGEGTSYGNAGVLASSSVVPVTVPGVVRSAPGMLFNPDKPLFLKWGYLPRLMPWLLRYLSHATAEEASRIADGLALIVTGSLEEHQQLAAGTGAERYITPSDYTFAYKSRAQYEADAFGFELRGRHGMTWSVLEGEAIRAYDPALGPDIGCLVPVHGNGHIKDPGAYVKALARHAETLGVRFVRGTAERVITADSTVTGVRVDGETIPADCVVVATGVWSKSLAAEFGLDVPLESERGYHIELFEPSLMPAHPTMVASGKFVATPMEGRVRLAGIVEFGGLDAPPSRAPFELLLRQARAAFPGLTWGETKEWMGHRPATTDSLPLVGAVPTVRGAYVAFGHHHIGLTSGPKTGRLLAQLIGGTPLNVDISPLAPSRFLKR